MTTFDAIIIIVYLCAMLVVGYFVGRDNESKDDYFLAGRSMPWLPLALSVAATMISANGFIGGPGWSYNDGMFPFMVNIATPIGILVAISITAPVMYHLRVTSIYQYMDYRLGPITRLLTVLQFFINSLLQVSSMVFIPAVIIKMITGWELSIIVPFIVIIALIYTLIGGIKAVIWTDAIQMFIVVGSVIYIIASAIEGTGLGIFDTIATAKEAGKLQTLNFSLDFATPNLFWATLIGGSVMWIRYFCFDQVQVQRVLTAKNIKGVKKSLLFSGISMNIIYYFILFIGTILFVFYGGKEFATSNEIMINYILNELPVGMVGIVISGVFAAAMSSVDSLINSMTTVFTIDIYERYISKDRKELGLRSTMMVSACIGVLIIFIVLIGFGDSVRSVLDLVGSYLSYFTGPAAGVFLLAFFTKKANDKGSSIGFISGFLAVLIISNTFTIDWLWNPVIGVSVTVAVGYMVSCILGGEMNPDKIKYNAWEIRKKMIKDNKISEDGVSIVPFKIDKYAVIIFAFFLVQYVILAMIQYL